MCDDLTRNFYDMLSERAQYQHNGVTIRCQRPTDDSEWDSITHATMPFLENAHDEIELTRLMEKVQLLITICDTPIQICIECKSFNFTRHGYTQRQYEVTVWIPKNAMHASHQCTVDDYFNRNVKLLCM